MLEFYQWVRFMLEPFRLWGSLLIGSILLIAFEPNFKDKGKWQVSADGTLCVVWKIFNKGKEVCNSNWVVDGEKVSFIGASGNTFTNRIVKGNPRKLK